MTLNEAIRVLCWFHTRDDWQSGYTVEGAAAQPMVTPFSLADYVTAWGVLRQHIGLATTGFNQEQAASVEGDKPVRSEAKSLPLPS